MKKKIILTLEINLLIGRVILLLFSLKLKKKNRAWELSSCCGCLLRSHRKEKYGKNDSCGKCVVRRILF
jgi:hypothetical protein